MFAPGLQGRGARGGGGPQGLGGAKPALEAPGERAKGAVGAADRRRGHAAGVGSPVPVLPGATFAPLAAGALLLRSAPPPGAKGCFLGPWAHSGAARGANRLGHRSAPPVYRPKITARNPAQRG